MLRKLCKASVRWLLPAIIFVATGSLTNELAAQPKTPAPKPATEQANTATEAALWARTAEYVYQGDPELKPIAAKLVAGIGRSSLRSFKLSLNEAVKLEGKPLVDSHVFTFQSTVFDKVQNRHPADAAALATAIQNELLSKRSNRVGDASFQTLRQDLIKLAAGPTAVSDAPAVTPAQAVATTTTTTAPLPAADTVQRVVTTVPPAAPATPTSTLLWLALGMSGLSLAGVIYLLLTRSQSAAAPAQADYERTPRPRHDDPIKWEQITRYVQQELGKSKTPASPAPVATAKAAPPAKAPAVAKTPAPAAAVAPEPAALPAEDDALFAIAAPAAPTPRRRTQYVNEAPFNNSFPARALTEQPGTYSLYAIDSTEQQPDQGTFTVTGNHASHIRDHRNVLEPVCEYTSYPSGSETRIITERPGQVRRRGLDWEVTSPAKIRFE